MEQTQDRRGAGGTPGGVWQFVGGLVLAAVGGYLLLNQVQVTTSFWHFWGANTFGLTLLPLLIGIGILFYNGRSVAGWLLVIVGLAIIVAGILMNMDIYFRSTSLFNTLVMLALLAGGLGLVARSLRPQPVQPSSGNGSEQR
jgi:predicted membrane channel-forming protein YqfA (hemolysin III family)